PFREKIMWRVQFDDVGGLKAGNEVRTSGVEVGKVKEIGLEDGAAIVTIQVFKELPYYEDGKITIASVSPLGGKFVAIEPGGPRAPLADTSEIIYGEAPPEDITDALNRLVKHIREGEGTIPMLLRDREVYDDIKKITGSVSDIVGDIQQNKGLVGKLLGPDSEELYADVRQIVSSVRDAADQLKQKKGTLGKLIYDDAVYDQINAATKSVQTIAANIEAGKGTIGKLMTDEELYNNIRDITRAIQTGDGVIGRLINDEEMGREFGDLVDNLNNIAASISKGEGTLGKLVYDDKLYADAASMMASLKTAANNIASGDGTLSKLINESELYNKVDRLITELTEATEDAREAAPITAFATVLLAGFR
ncbi:MAG: MCE family protein, partial [Planctomycetes bacterium]|nr:MCE family protein [Planctomycetota bacterium]